MAEEGGGDSLDVQETAAVGHFAHGDVVDLQAGGGQRIQGGAHRRVDFAGNQDEAGAGGEVGRHSVAELGPAVSESGNSARVGGGKFVPAQVRNRAETGQGVHQ